MARRDLLRAQALDPGLLQEIEDAGLLAAKPRSRGARSRAPQVKPRAIIGNMIAGQPNTGADFHAEAIVVRYGFPALLIRNGEVETPQRKLWRDALLAGKTKIDTAIMAVGRIEVDGHPQLKWIGTGFLIDPRTVVTNRHVAVEFAQSDGSRFALKPGMAARIDLREEVDTTSDPATEFSIDDVVHIETMEDRIDLALLRLSTAAARRLTVDPLPLETQLDDGALIAAIGYPAWSPFNDEADQDRIFNDIYEVKRLSPGKIIGNQPTDRAFQHNCTTLGGMSGSPVINLATGAVAGLHFSGAEGVANNAVRAEWLLDRCRTSKVKATLAGGPPKPKTATDKAITKFAGRDGYDPAFLGTGDLDVPLPGLNWLQRRDTAPVAGGSFELRYRHFSVVMNKARRLAWFTACNIDGKALVDIARGKDKWFLDPRIDAAAQADNDLYKGRNNDFDRGHLVRRLDPVWGEQATAEEAMDDSFFYTNCTPQHKDLNRRIWLALEDHILGATGVQDLKISVFAGPIFSPSDPVHKPTGIPVPRGFWKVIASTLAQPRRKTVLQAQGFILWQGHLIDNDDLEAIFGSGFETHQYTIAELERMTGLDFHALKDADTFGQAPTVESVAGGAVSGGPQSVPLPSLDRVLL